MKQFIVQEEKKETKLFKLPWALKTYAKPLYI